MSRSFGLVDYKVLEAEFFLNELNRISKLGENFNVSGVQFCASAFVSASRSITFAMQASLKNQSEFDDWYGCHQESLRQNSLAKFFHNFRTVTQHVGESVVNGGMLVDGKMLFLFCPCKDLPKVPVQDVLTACEEYFRIVLSIVYDCYLKLGNLIDGQQYYTQENFFKLGKSIEDAEEELGFPRGWTQIGLADEHLFERWNLLRKNAGGCEIEDVFLKWLDLKLPRNI